MSSYLLSAAFNLPESPRPIVVIGAGGIMEEAHLPAYLKAGWPVQSIYDIQPEKAERLAGIFGIPKVHSSIEALIRHAPPDAVFDIAVPASKLTGILELLPAGAGVMMQKPMGETLQAAAAILRICESKGFTASVNFQMKLIPSIIAAKNLIDQGAIGELHDMEIRMNIHHPWELWDFLFGLPRMEMLYHSIHYMDMIRYFLGMPNGIYAKTFQHPKQMQLASTRSVIIFDYDRPVRAFINTNHGHDFGIKHQDSFVKWEGSKGAIKATLGKNINFPKGEADHFEYFLSGQAQQGWTSADIPGAWYPDAFIATMADLQCAIENPASPHVTSVKHAYDTMRLVEAAYLSSDSGGTDIPD
ncbi:putative dehydrogenase [Anseongella ginsenosidimutans]|uniref:Putative dehydrogenase n=1 Tax=Anseongella ginsenosidimutans TaxID=496056 RepID=A0A4R3KWQ4_9SPHI|nr:Gfo/Idh/MocA family oxidoreductase [Anseongella ginsenosidimutans]QEC51118.1 Gfo/Idh/MocA family oxidoreductase [Anseongella ginsenosidimutans]TCS90219.1 putative dehydrogenase [Anseongella ginsenosidimutans]